MVEERPIFEYEKVEGAIKKCVDVFNELDLTMMEALHVVKSLEGGLIITMGPEIYEKCSKLYATLGVLEPPIDEEASSVDDLDADSIRDSDN